MPVARRLGRYTLLEKIGTGGLADVFVAESSGADGFRKRVVIKRVRDALGDDPTLRPEAEAALEAEANLARTLGHGNIVQVFDFGRDDDGAGYVVMEWVEGCSLRELLDAGLDIHTVGPAILIVEAVAAALDYAHTLTDPDDRALGLVHRDVKPGNILLSKRGVVKLTDFGIAKTRTASTLTVPGFVKGTPRYISPEQAAAKRVDARADVYALGVVLGELVENPPQELARIIERATELAPRDRFPSMAEFAQALLTWRTAAGLAPHPRELAALVRDTLGVPAQAPAIDLNAALAQGEPAPRTRSVSAGPDTPTTRRRWIVLGGSAAVISALGVAAWTGRTPPEPTNATPTVAEPVATDDPPPAERSARVPQTELLEPGKGVPEASPPKVPMAVESTDPPPPRTPTQRKRGRLKINVLPYAEVTLDGKAIGRTPVDRSVIEGAHTVVLTNPTTGRRTTQQIRIDAGRTRTLKRW